MDKETLQKMANGTWIPPVNAEYVPKGLEGDPSIGYTLLYEHHLRETTVLLETIKQLAQELLDAEEAAFDSACWREENG